jgi:DedD protein
MRLPFLRSKEDPASDRGRVSASAGGDQPLDAAHARTRARQRLVGALVLLAVGVIGFPILFETRPRPLPVDTPIEIVRHEGGSTGPAAAGKVRPVTLPPQDAGIETAPAASAAVATAAPAPQASVPASAARASVPSPAVVPPERPAKPPAEEAPRPKPVAAPAATPAVPASAAPASAAQAARFVVQAGAYLDAASLRDARQKVEKLDLKTYTQVVETPTGKRTRVRVGPFESRAEAEAVAARIKATGLSVVVLTL